MQENYYKLQQMKLKPGIGGLSHHLERKWIGQFYSSQTPHRAKNPQIMLSKE